VTPFVLPRSGAADGSAVPGGYQLTDFPSRRPLDLVGVLFSLRSVSEGQGKMARPWPKRSVWPYVCKNGRKSYTVGFYDHDKRERSRSFPTVRHRRTLMPAILIDDLADWRALLASRGHRTANVDFVIPGNLGGIGHGVREPDTGACHFGEQQVKTWRRRCFTPAVQRAAEHPELADIRGATPYALRRGAISLRLRVEDPQTVARECGTSLQMLNSHYAFAIEDLRHREPRPADVEWREARAALLERRAGDEARSSDAQGAGSPRRMRLGAWLTVQRRRFSGP
jgi:hypothetical protein